MRLFLIAALTLQVLSGGCASVASLDNAIVDGSDLSSVAWMSGVWRTAPDDEGVITEEHWSEPAGNTMFGYSRTFAGGETVFFEYVRMAYDDDGVLTYLASPNGRSPATPFSMTRIGPNHVRFENPAHDFPQAIEYVREDARHMRATISGIIDGETQESEWVYRR